jgi:hypothetical protein
MYSLVPVRTPPPWPTIDPRVTLIPISSEADWTSDYTKYRAGVVPRWRRNMAMKALVLS